MKRRPLIISLALVVLVAVLAPPSAFASLAGWFYRAQCRGAITDFVPSTCPDDGIAGTTNLLRVTIPAYAGNETFGGVDLKFIAPKGPKNGIGFQSLTFRGTNTIGEFPLSDVWVVLYFTQGPPVIVTLYDFDRSCSRGCLDQYTVTAADLPGTGSRIVNRIRLLARGDNSNSAKAGVFGKVEVTQSLQSGISPTLWTSVSSVCNTPQPNLL